MLSISAALLLFVAALASAALFAYLETTVTALRLFEINQLEARTLKFSRLFAIWRSAPHRILITILVASNFADVVCSVLLTSTMQQLISGDLGTILGVFLSTFFIVFLGNIVPKSYARTKGKHIALPALYTMNILLTLLKPVIDISSFLMSLFSKKAPSMHGSDDHNTVSEQEIAFLIDYSDQKGMIEPHKSEMLQNIFSLGHKTASSIMIPTGKMVMLEVSTPIEKAHELFLSYRYTRIPLYEKSPSNVIGFIYQKDLFALLFKQTSGALIDFMRPVLYIGHAKKTNELLKEFLRKRRHLAIVTNDRNGAIGMVTLEDVLEEIVGEITDEHESQH